MIYHVVNKPNWEKALQQGFYEHPSLTLEGFIHASKKEQVQGVIERYYTNQNNLLLLHIDEAKLTSPIVYELAPSVNQDFPHIYGRLNLDAVIEVSAI